MKKSEQFKITHHICYSNGILEKDSYDIGSTEYRSSRSMYSLSRVELVDLHMKLTEILSQPCQTQKN